MAHTTTRTLIKTIAVLLPLGLLSCNKYEMFRLAGYEQNSFGNQVDVLFVIDNSGSMSDEAEGLMSNFSSFIETLAGENGAGTATETLTDAVGNYITYTADRGRIVDYQLAITTTSDRYSDGFTPDPDPGEVGLLLGEQLVLAKGDPNVETSFQQNVGCWATCWSGYEMPTDPTYGGVPGNCTFPENGVASKEYLDCVCLGIEYPVESVDWDDNALCGSGEEKPIEAVLQSLCRSVEEPPEVCEHLESEFDPDRDTLSNPDWLREDATLVVIIVTDEGDSSDLYSAGDDDPANYLEAFAQFDRPIKFAAIGPDLNCDENGDCALRCNSGGATPNGIRRIQKIVEATGGFYRPITQGGAEDDDEDLTGCEPANYSVHLEDLGRLLISLETAFQLQSVPDESTLRVYVDDEPVLRSEPLKGDEESNSFSNDSYTDGWSYNPGNNSVMFWGSAIPDFNQNVQIFYRPVDGNPRELPF